MCERKADFALKYYVLSQKVNRCLVEINLSYGHWCYYQYNAPACPRDPARRSFLRACVLCKEFALTVNCTRSLSSSFIMIRFVFDVRSETFSVFVGNRFSVALTCDANILEQTWSLKASRVPLRPQQRRPRSACPTGTHLAPPALGCVPT